MTEIEKLPPHNLEAEKLLLGGLLCDQKEMDLVMDLIAPSDLYDPQHQTIWHEMVSAHVNNTPWDIGILMGDLIYMTTLKADAPVGTGLTRYAKVIKEEANKRKVYEAAQKAEKQADNGQTAQDLIDTLTHDLAQIRGSGPSESILLENLLPDALSHVEAVCKGDKDRIGRTTGFPALDHYLGGLVAGALYLIAARPSIGKTALGLSIMLRSASDSDKAIFLASMEMSREELALRLLSQQSGVPLAKIRSGRVPREDIYGEYDYVTQGDFEKLSNAAADLSEMPIIIDDTAHLTPTQLSNNIKRSNTKKEIGLVIVDYIQLMAAEGRGIENYERVSEASRQLKIMARNFNCPVIGLSQLNRECEKRGDKRPMLSDLRESGSLEQDADAVMFIYRPAYYSLPNSPADFAEIIISKQRNGPCGQVPLQWIADEARFGDG